MYGYDLRLREVEFALIAPRLFDFYHDRILTERAFYGFLGGEGLFVVVYLCFFLRAHTRVYTHTRGTAEYDVDNNWIRALSVCEGALDHDHKFTVTDNPPMGKCRCRKIRATIARKGRYFDRQILFKAFWKTSAGIDRKISALRSCHRLCDIVCDSTCSVDHR